MKRRTLLRTFSLLLAATILISLSACSGGSGNAESSGNAGSGGSSASPSAPLDLIIGTGGLSGSWYPMAGAMAAEMSKSAYVNATVQSSAGTPENIRTVMSGERDLGVAMPSALQQALDGTGIFEGEADPSLRALFSFAPSLMHFVVRSDNPANCIRDLAGQTVAVGAAGSGDEMCAKEILQALGMSYDDIDEKFLSNSDMPEAFKDGTIDAMFLVVTPPAAAFIDASAYVDCKLIPVAGEERELIGSKYPHYTNSTIKAGTYTFTTEDVETMESGCVMFCKDVISEDAVYDMLSKMYEGVDTIRQAHSALSDFSIENSLNGIPIPLHPGAEKFFKEKGVL